MSPRRSSITTLVVDDLLTELDKHGFYVQGFADDLVILLKTQVNDARLYGRHTKFRGVIARMQVALSIVEN